MSTNYFYREDTCNTCGRSDKRHIGKSSLGWCFGLHVYPDDGIHTLEDWVARFERGGQIETEYGEVLTTEQMVEVIRRDNPKLSREGFDFPDEGWFQSNHAERGPKGLYRHRVDHCYCIGHGEGAWDHMLGDFR
jgi:hypothetical protein